MEQHINLRQEQEWPRIVMMDRWFGCELRYIEHLIEFQSISWGLWLLYPVDTFTGSRGYALAAQLAPEWAWGSVAVISGLVLLVALRREMDRLRRHALAAQMLVFLGICVVLTLSNPTSTGTPMYFWASVMCGFARLRLARRARHVVRK